MYAIGGTMHGEMRDVPEHRGTLYYKRMLSNEEKKLHSGWWHTHKKITLIIYMRSRRYFLVLLRPHFVHVYFFSYVCFCCLPHWAPSSTTTS